MASRPIWLVKCRQSKAQRAHFALFIPNASDAQKNPNDKAVECRGTIIHVVGAPMAGYKHEFKHFFDCRASPDVQEVIRLGSVDEHYIQDSDVESIDGNALGILDKEALKIGPPGVSQNFLAPVNDVSPRRNLSSSSLNWEIVSLIGDLSDYK